MTSETKGDRFWSPRDESPSTPGGTSMTKPKKNSMSRDGRRRIYRLAAVRGSALSYRVTAIDDLLFGGIAAGLPAPPALFRQGRCLQPARRARALATTDQNPLRDPPGCNRRISRLPGSRHVAGASVEATQRVYEQLSSLSRVSSASTYSNTASRTTARSPRDAAPPQSLYAETKVAPSAIC
jgi:hypothetical protein